MLGRVLKVSNFTKEGPSCCNSKTNPEAPDNTTENGEDFMAKEL